MMIKGIEYTGLVLSYLKIAQIAKYKVIVQVGAVQYSGVPTSVDEMEDGLILTYEPDPIPRSGEVITKTHVIKLSAVQSVTMDSIVNVEEWSE